MAARGLENVRQVLGKRLTAAHRNVLGVERTHDAFGHGITVLAFEGAQLVVRPGPDEDYLVIDTGSFDPSVNDPFAMYLVAASATLRSLDRRHDA